MLAPDRPIWDKADEIKEVEHKCDFLTHEIIQRLNRTFVTPIDREDIHALARSLDDVMDAIDASATLIRLYRLGTRAVRRPRAGAHHLGVRARGPAGARRRSRRTRAFAPTASRSTASRTKPTGSTSRPSAGCSTRRPTRIVIIKWKETLDFLEEATDRCEDVANVIEGVIVKHG